MKLVKHVLQYISETLDLCLKFDVGADTRDNVVGYTHSNFVGSITNRKSTKGYVFILARAAISHLSKLQSVVALSSWEAEYVAIYEARKEAGRLGYLLAELEFQKRSTLVTLFVDNEDSIAFSNNPQFHSHMKHIDVRFHKICEAISIKQLGIVYIPIEEMTVNGRIKALPTLGFWEF